LTHNFGENTSVEEHHNQFTILLFDTTQWGTWERSETSSIINCQPLSDPPTHWESSRTQTPHTSILIDLRDDSQSCVEANHHGTTHTNRGLARNARATQSLYSLHFSAQTLHSKLLETRGHRHLYSSWSTPLGLSAQLGDIATTGTARRQGSSTSRRCAYDPSMPSLLRSILPSDISEPHALKS
jgi:hypothetical protein